MKIRLQDSEEQNFSNSQNLDEQNVYNQSDIAQALVELNKDNLGDKNSEIDLRARLHPFELSALLALDSLVAIGFLPIQTLALSRQKKRLSVSLKGLGRKEIISVVAGHQEQLAKKGGLGGVFGGKQ